MQGHVRAILLISSFYPLNPSYLPPSSCFSSSFSSSSFSQIFHNSNSLRRRKSSAYNEIWNFWEERKFLICHENLIRQIDSRIWGFFPDWILLSMQSLKGRSTMHAAWGCCQLGFILPSHIWQSTVLFVPSLVSHHLIPSFIDNVQFITGDRFWLNSTQWTDQINNAMSKKLMERGGWREGRERGKEKGKGERG